MFTNDLPAFQSPPCRFAGPLRHAHASRVLGLLRDLRPTTRSSVGSGPVPARTGCPAPGTTTDGSHVHFMFDRPGRHPALPRQHRHTYAADIRRGLPAVQHTRHGVGFPAKRKPRAASRPISARFEPVLRSRGVNHWFALAVPSGPASRTRTIWQYWRVPTSSELLPTLTGAPRIRLLPASTQPLRRPGGGGLPPPLEHQAPRGARAGRRTLARLGCC